MRVAIRVLALSAIGVAAFGPAVHAQDMTTYSFSGTTIYIGGGFQYLTLPDIKFTAKGNENSVRDGGRVDFHQNNSDFSEYGGAGGAGIETALGYWGGTRVTGGVKGFFSSLENSDNKGCSRTEATLHCVRSDRTTRRRRGLLQNQDRSRCRLLGWPGRAKIRPRGAGAREAQFLPE
jgi:hypothetical protein